MIRCVQAVSGVHADPAMPGETVQGQGINLKCQITTCSDGLVLCLNISVYLQVWLSPWQVSHVLSIVSFVESTLNRVVGPVPGVPPATSIAVAAIPDQSVPTGLAASAMKTQLKLTLSLEISLISVLCLVSCPTRSQPQSICGSDHLFSPEPRRIDKTCCCKDLQTFTDSPLKRW